MDYQEDKEKLDINDIDHLNLDTNEMSWDSATERNPRSMGSKANSAIGQPTTNMEMPSHSRSQEETTKLGQIIDLEMPPGTPPEASANPIGNAATETPKDTSPGFNSNVFAHAPSSDLNTAQATDSSSIHQHLESIKTDIQSTGKLAVSKSKELEKTINEQIDRDGSFEKIYDLIRGTA